MNMSKSVEDQLKQRLGTIAHERGENCHARQQVGVLSAGPSLASSDMHQDPKSLAELVPKIEPDLCMIQTGSPSDFLWK